MFKLSAFTLIFMLAGCGGQGTDPGEPAPNVTGTIVKTASGDQYLEDPVACMQERGVNIKVCTSRVKCGSGVMVDVGCECRRAPITGGSINFIPVGEHYDGMTDEAVCTCQLEEPLTTETYLVVASAVCR